MASPGLRDWDLFCYIPYLTKVNVLLPRHKLILSILTKIMMITFTKILVHKSIIFLCLRINK